MLNVLMLDAAPSPEVFYYMILGLSAFFVVIGLVTLSIIFIVKAIRKKKASKSNEESDGRA